VASSTPEPTTDTAAVPGRRSVLWRLRFVGFGALVLGVVAIGGVWTALNTLKLPPERRPVETSFVCDSTVEPGQCGFDTAMARLRTEEERVLVDYEQLPPVLVQAVLSAEDRKFFDHNGVDPLGITRALYQDVLGGSESLQGGSTITQQYVKNVYLTSERSLDRKLREAVLAIKLERELDKREILTRYLNEVYFGRGAYGVEAAARAYFGVNVEELDLAQSAYLAGLIRSPETADATRDPEVASQRRDSVLVAMVEEGHITQADADRVGALPWLTEPSIQQDGSVQPATILERSEETTDFGPVRYDDIGSEYWVDLVRRQLRERFGPGAETRGFRVYTTFDPDLQEAAVESVNSTVNQPDGPLGSLVSVDTDGRVAAMVAGRDYQSAQVNLALGAEGGGAGRSPGSTFKPIALAAFVEDGFSVDSRYEAPPTTQFPGVTEQDGSPWRPANYDRADHGVETVEQATWQSTNTVYAGMVDQLGPERLASMANRLGVTAELDPVYSLVLGAEGVSVLDMASAYSTFSRHGVRIDPYIIERIEDSDGTVVFDAAVDVPRQQVIAPDVADTVTSVLTGVISRGTGKAAAFGSPAAGKTGTTDNAEDAWFAGYTCDLTAVVWMGYEVPREMTTSSGGQMSGGATPARMWRSFMSRATADDDDCDYAEVDYGDKVLNSEYSPSRSSKRSSQGSSGSSSGSTTSTTTPSGSSSTSVPRSTATVPRSTTTAPRPTTTPPSSPPTTATSGGG